MATLRAWSNSRLWRVCKLWVMMLHREFQILASQREDLIHSPGTRNLALCCQQRPISTAQDKYACALSSSPAPVFVVLRSSFTASKLFWVLMSRVFGVSGLRGSLQFRASKTTRQGGSSFGSASSLRPCGHPMNPPHFNRLWEDVPTSCSEKYTILRSSKPLLISDNQLCQESSAFSSPRTRERSQNLQGIRGYHGTHLPLCEECDKS